MARFVQLGNTHLTAAPDVRRRAPPVRCDFVADGGAGITTTEGLPLQATAQISSEKYDCIYIPMLVDHDYAALVEALETNGELVSWLREQWQGGATLATAHTGMFLLAETGLLDGRRMPVPVRFEREFRQRYPRVVIDRTAPVIESDRMIRTASGAATYSLSLRVFHHLAGPAAAKGLAAAMSNRLGYGDHSPFVLFYLDRLDTNGVFDRALHWMRARIGDDFQLCDLAGALAVSERTLIRHFKSATGSTPIEYLRQLRLQLAKAMLEETSVDLGDISTAVGYKEYTSFARSFQRRFGLSPGKIRTQVRPARDREQSYIL